MTAVHGNPVLRTRAEPVTAFGRDLAALVDDRFDTMYAIETGVGLAGAQAGDTTCDPVAGST